MRSLKPNLVYQLAISFLYSIAPLIVFPYVSRVLGPAHIGSINFIDYTSQFFILFASFGIPLYGVREIARSRNQPEERSRIGSELVMIHVIITLISLCLFAALLFVRHDALVQKELVVLAMINIAGSALGIEWMIHGMEDFSFLAKRSFIVKILSLAAIFILVRRSDDYILFYFLLTAGNVLLLILDAGYMIKKGFAFRSGMQLKRHLRPLAVFFLTTVTLSLYTFFDTVILGFIAGSLAVGYYTTSLKVIRLAHSLINDLGAVLLPRVSYLVEQLDKTEISRIVNKSMQYVLTITVPLSLFFFLTAKEIILVLGGDAFAGSIVALQILSLLPVVIGLTNVFFIQILLPFGREKTILAGVVIGSMISIAANLLLCPVYAHKGAAISCVAAESFVALFLGFRAAGFVRFSFNPRFIPGIVLSSCIFVPVVFLVRMFSINGLSVLIVSGLSCFLFYSLLQLFLFRNQILKEVLGYARARITSKKRGR